MSAPSQSDAELIARYIEPSPLDMGPGDARVRPSMVRVRAVIGQYLATGRDPALVAGDYDLPLEAVQAALAYYAEHQYLIDAWLATHTIQ